MQTTHPAQHLIVAADFHPDEATGRLGVRDQVRRLADDLAGTGVIIKVNTILRGIGYDLIDELQSHGLLVFADLKLNDISATLATDGKFLRESNPDFLTVMCSAGVSGMHALKTEVPDTEVLGVTVLTNLTNSETQDMFNRSPGDAVIRFAHLAKRANLPGLICSPAEVPALREEFADQFTLNTPGVRPSWAIIPSDDQNPERVMTPAKAIEAGATRIVVGRPILTPPPGMTRREAVDRTLEEIASVL